MSKTWYYLILILLVNACSNGSKTKSKFTVLKDKTNTYKYELAYEDTSDYKQEIDSIIKVYYNIFDAYNQNSLVYKFNNTIELSQKDNQTYLKYKSLFVALDSISKLVKRESNGAYNAGLGGLYMYWHSISSSKNVESIDTKQIEKLLLLDYGSLIEFDSLKPKKNHLQQNVNFNALIGSMAIKAISEWLDSTKHIKNYYININGDIKVNGNNSKDSYWPIIVEKPYLNSLKVEEYCKIPVKNFYIGTENSYKNFFLNNGIRYSHTINPLTGQPTKTTILSVYVLSNNIIYAKAMSLACLVNGSTKSISILSSKPDIKGFILYEESEKMLHWNSLNLPIELPSKGKN